MRATVVRRGADERTKVSPLRPLRARQQGSGPRGDGVSRDRLLLAHRIGDATIVGHVRDHVPRASACRWRARLATAVAGAAAAASTEDTADSGGDKRNARHLHADMVKRSHASRKRGTRSATGQRARGEPVPRACLRPPASGRWSEPTDRGALMLRPFPRPSEMCPKPSCSRARRAAQWQESRSPSRGATGHQRAGGGALCAKARCSRVEAVRLMCATGRPLVTMGIVLPPTDLDAIVRMGAHRRREARLPCG